MIMDDMKKVVVTRPYYGICMQVCAAKGATNKQILEECNSSNPSGTSNGWSKVIRTKKDLSDSQDEKYLPVICEDHPDRKHYIVVC